MSKLAGVNHNLEVHMATTFGQLADAIGELPRHWWVVALRGLAAIIFGVLAFIWPAITLGVLILFYGAYAIVDGALALYAAIRSRGQPVWALLMEGILGIGAGLVAFFWPAITALALLYVIAAWAILTGVVEVIAAVRLRQAITNEWALILSGVLSVVFGLLLVIQPGAGALTLVWLIGLYAVLFGLGLLAFAWRLHGLLEHMPAVSPPVSQTRRV
jgi:uncharacterized membrane protein HdeD (DUF308 family)